MNGETILTLVAADNPGVGVTPSEVYRLLGAWYIFQDQLGWNRTQALLVVEGATLATGLSKEKLLSAVLVFIGSGSFVGSTSRFRETGGSAST
jgi:hypothetical protein